MTTHTIVTALFLGCVLVAGAQTKKKARAAAKPVKTAKAAAAAEKDGISTRQRHLFEEMLDNTQRLFAIDSTVVNADDVQKAIPLVHDLGQSLPYNKCFKDKNLPGVYVYMNGFENKCYYAESDSTGLSQLYCREKLGGQWSAPQAVKGIGAEYRYINYPFMTSDGETFFFAAKNEQGLGGYDIYMTRYDSDEGKFLEPENVGLPYNSFYDDFFYIADDVNNFIWFASTRRQPTGKACVYTICKPDKRVNYDVDDYDEKKMENLAQLSRIRDTWVTPKQRDDAMARLLALRQTRTGTDSADSGSRPFVIDDSHTCTSASQLASPTARQLYAQWLTLAQQRDELDTTLDHLRVQYRNTPEAEKKALGRRIRTAEEKMTQTLSDLDNTAKKLRKTVGNTQ